MEINEWIVLEGGIGENGEESLKDFPESINICHLDLDVGEDVLRECLSETTLRLRALQQRIILLYGYAL